jgi:hypothetical protein
LAKGLSDAPAKGQVRVDLAIVDLSEANLHFLFDWSRRARGQDVGRRYCLYWKDSASTPSGPLSFWLKHGFCILREDEHSALVHRELGEERHQGVNGRRG